MLRFTSPALFAIAVVGSLAACDMRVEALTFRGVAERGDDAALEKSTAAKKLAAYALYKSAPCADPGADTCLDERAVGNSLPQADGEGLLVPLEGDALPSDEFARGSESAPGNVRFENDAHPGATWAYSWLIVAPFNNEDNDISAKTIDKMADSAPFGIGALRVETFNMDAKELEALGLNPSDEDGKSSTILALPLPEKGVKPTILDPKDDVVKFPVVTLGTIREQLLTFPTMFGDDEHLQSLKTE